MTNQKKRDTTGFDQHIHDSFLLSSSGDAPSDSTPRPHSATRFACAARMAAVDRLLDIVAGWASGPSGSNEVRFFEILPFDWLFDNQIDSKTIREIDSIQAILTNSNETHNMNITGLKNIK